MYKKKDPGNDPQCDTSDTLFKNLFCRIIIDTVIPGELIIAAFRERASGIIGSICSETFVAKPSFVGCHQCDYVELCEIGEKTGE